MMCLVETLPGVGAPFEKAEDDSPGAVTRDAFRRKIDSVTLKNGLGHCCDSYSLPT